MPKVIELMNGKDIHGGWMIECPGCGYGHMFDDRWTFNGDFEKPTFSPSMLVNQDRPDSRCHSFVRDGKIQYLSDCFHKYAGQTLNLEDV